MKLNNQDFDDLVDGNLVTRRTDERGFSTYKYKNKVFYKNLWHKHPLLLEARGVVFDADGEVVNRPFKKAFNIGENGTKIDPDRFYCAVRKINGFMAAASIHNGELVVSTTGTTTSEYAKLARNYVEPYKEHISMTHTMIFEVCDPSDPHIVEEEAGLYLLGIRSKHTGELTSQNIVRKWARQDFGKDIEYEILSGYNILNKVRDVKHEGFALYDIATHEMVAKIKSPHYLSKKAMMRMGGSGANWMFDNPASFRMKRLDEEFYDVQQYILDNYSKEDWLGAKEQDRRKVIEEYFYA